MKLSLLISILVAFVASQIELLDSVERKVENLLYVLGTAFLSYFFDIFFISIPISAFRFFLRYKEKINYLQVFGLNRKKFALYIFFGFLIFFLVFLPTLSGIFSKEIRYSLKSEKGQVKDLKVYHEDRKIMIYVPSGEKGKYNLFILSDDGKIVGRKLAYLKPEFSIFPYIISSIWLAFTSVVSYYFGINSVSLGWIPVIFLLGFHIYIVF